MNGSVAAPSSTFWMVFGFIGSFMFFSRLAVQWWQSEKAGRPVIPVVYWHLSIAGTAILLSYAIFRQDPVFILTYLLPLSIYLRQLILHIRTQRLLGPVHGSCPHCGKSLNLPAGSAAPPSETRKKVP
ncbi:MAG: lipid-A-disaccharide synthase N-terminal domain-containing protein [Planctomycetota bacterium]